MLAKPLNLLVLFIAAIIALALPRSALRNTVFFSFVALFWSRFPWHMMGQYSPYPGVHDDYVAFTNYGCLTMVWFDWFLVTDFDNECYLTEGASAGKTGASLDWKDRLKRSALVHLNCRGIGWNWLVQNTPKALPKGYNKW
jgi:hypothetical protein